MYCSVGQLKKLYEEKKKYLIICCVFYVQMAEQPVHTSCISIFKEERKKI